jgi:RHS repeat-associated protein
VRLFFHQDLIGSVRAVTDQAGALVAASDYSPYGVEVEVGAAVLVSSVTVFGFAGEQRDPTGLVYLRARFYDPATAQFVSIDPLVDVTLTVYGYTNGNPLQFTDPSGMSWWNPLDWNPDIVDKVSLVLGGAAVVCAATGVAAPIGAVLGVAATVTSGIATVNHYRNGDSGVDIALSAAGAIPGVGSAVARGVRGAIRLGAKIAAHGAPIARSIGAGWKAVRVGLDLVDDLLRAPLSWASAGRSAWCGGLI